MKKSLLLVAAAALFSASLLAGIRQQAAHGKPEYDAAMSKAKAEMKAALAYCNKPAIWEDSACTAHARAAYNRSAGEAKAMYRKLMAQASS